MIGARVRITDVLGMREIVKFALGPIRVDELRFADGSLYMRRWLFGWKNWPGLRLHNIVAPDADRALHDHPFDFTSVCLRGGYYEIHRRGWTIHRPGNVIRRKAEDQHRITAVLPGTWTLVLRGAYRRGWGFAK